MMEPIGGAANLSAGPLNNVVIGNRQVYVR